MGQSHRGFAQMNVNYPGGIKPCGHPLAHKKRIVESAANRGMGFEPDINATNAYYLEQGLALSYKRTTNINVVQVDYAQGAPIIQAYFDCQSTTDYNGVYN